MSDESQHPLNDELLSAYLDDELSGAERALVEARLESDPAARRMLDELRHVSQTMQGLPRESVGHDLRGAVLQRIENTKQAAAAPESTNGASAAGYSLLKISIGRTTRAWAWASLALAAGLLIMILQPGRDGDAVLPEVALQSKERATPSADESDVAKWHAPPAPVSGPVASATPQSAPVELRVEDGISANGRLGSELIVSGGATPDAPALTASAPDGAAAVSEPKEKALENAPAGGTGGIAASAEEPELVVVRVLAKPAAVATKTFDKLLASNGIVVESEPNETESLGAPLARRIQPTEPPPSDDRVEKAPPEGTADVDLVFVEAPSSAIFGCLDGLNKDQDNYYAVDIEEHPADERAGGFVEAPVNKLANNFTQFNRGVMPQQQKDALQVNDKRLYFDGSDRYSAQPDGNGQLGDFSGGKQEAAQDLRGKLSLGRAMRVQAFANEKDELADASTRDAFVVESQSKKLAFSVDQLRRQLKEPADLKGENLQVLFYLFPTDLAESPATAPAAPAPATASPTATNRAE